MIFLETVLEFLELMCRTTDVYCLTKPLAISLDDMRYLPLNLMASFGELVPLPFKFLINLNSFVEQDLLMSLILSRHFVFLCSLISV